MARTVSSSSRKEVITDVVTTTLKAKGTGRSNAQSKFGILTNADAMVVVPQCVGEKNL